MSVRSISLVAVVFFVASSACAQGQNGGVWPDERQTEMREFVRERIQKFVRSLNLTGEQKEFLKLFRSRKQELQRKNMELLRGRTELSDLMRDQSSSREEVMRRADELIALQGQVHKARVSNLLDLRENLEPEQLRKLFAGLRKMKEFRDKGGFAQMGKGRGFGGPPRGKDHRPRRGEGSEGFFGGGERGSQFEGHSRGFRGSNSSRPRMPNPKMPMPGSDPLGLLELFE